MIIERNKIFFLFIVGVLIFGCQKQFTPKPRGYMRIDFPKKEYQLFDTIFPYKFEYPIYGRITHRNPENSEPYWIDIEFPKYEGKIHISYKSINNNLIELIEDSRTFVYKHTIKAKSINEIPIVKEDKNVYGILYEMKGNTASSIQFFVTDSLDRFLRGALYFYTQPNIDSLAPVISFFKKDIDHLLHTFEWTEHK